MAPRDSPAALAAPAMRSRYVGSVVSVTCAVVVWSISGILVRSVEEAGVWTLIFYRSAFMALTVLAILVAIHRGRVAQAFKTAGRLGVLAGLCFAVSSICYVSALLTTTVANAAFLSATAPVFTAALGWLVNRERVAAATWVAMAAAMGGVALMVGDGLAEGRLLGSILGLAAAVTFAAQMVILRAGRGNDMSPAMCMGACFAAIAGGLMAGTLAISTHDLTMTFIMGSVQLGVPLVLIAFGSRHLPAVQLSLLCLLDAVFNPIWVWLGVGEVPSDLTLLGGAIVLLAIAGEAIIGAGRARGAV